MAAKADSSRHMTYAEHAAATGVSDLGPVGRIKHVACDTDLRYGIRTGDNVLVYWCRTCILIYAFYRNANECPVCGVLGHEDKSHAWREPHFGVWYRRCPNFKLRVEEESIKNQGGKK